MVLRFCSYWFSRFSFNRLTFLFIINLIKIIIPGMLLNLLELRYTETLGVDAADHEQSLDDRVMNQVRIINHLHASMLCSLDTRNMNK